MIMIVPLVILALLSIGGGFIDAPKFLAPVFATGSVHVEVGHAENRTGEDPSVAHALSGQAARASMAEYEDKSTEHLLMGLSIGAGVLGFLLAFQLYYRRPELPGRIADGLGGLYRLVASKYYVDEIYNWMLIAPLIDVSRRWLWRGVDQGGIDTVVNDGAIGAREVGEIARHMQSGNLRSYAGWLAAGAAVVVAYMVWLGVR